jgi:hypothetical protein
LKGTCQEKIIFPGNKIGFLCDATSLPDCAVIQLLRSKWEEDKLSQTFPDYQTYAANTFWLWQR